MRVIGRTPRWRCMRTSARTLPAALARSRALFHGLSIRYPNFVRTGVTKCQKLRELNDKEDILMGHWSALISAVMTVACKTVCPICERTSPVRIFSALPVSRIISGSQSTLKTSPTIGSNTLNGNRTSSCIPFINLQKFGVQMIRLRTTRRFSGTYPGTVMIQFTLLLLCKGRTSNVLTC